MNKSNMFSSAEHPVRPLVYNVAEVSMSILDWGALQIVSLSCITISVPDCIGGWVLVRVPFSHNL